MDFQLQVVEFGEVRDHSEWVHDVPVSGHSHLKVPELWSPPSTMWSHSPSRWLELSPQRRPVFLNLSSSTACPVPHSRTIILDNCFPNPRPPGSCSTLSSVEVKFL